MCPPPAGLAAHLLHICDVESPVRMLPCHGSDICGTCLLLLMSPAEAGMVHRTCRCMLMCIPYMLIVLLPSAVWARVHAVWLAAARILGCASYRVVIGQCCIRSTHVLARAGRMRGARQHDAGVRADGGRQRARPAAPGGADLAGGGAWTSRRTSRAACRTCTRTASRTWTSRAATCCSRGACHSLTPASVEPSQPPIWRVLVKIGSHVA